MRSVSKRFYLFLKGFEFVRLDQQGKVSEEERRLSTVTKVVYRMGNVPMGTPKLQYSGRWGLVDDLCGVFAPAVRRGEV